MPGPVPAANVVIVGCGIIGLAAAERLTADGRSVVVIDQAGVAAGATGASGGLVRALDLAGRQGSRAADGLHRYLRRGWHGRWPPVREHGSLTLVDASGRELAAAAAAAAAAAGHQADLLSAEEVAARFPGLCVPAGFTGVYEPQAGWLPARPVAMAMLRDARDFGDLRLLRAQVTQVLTAGPRVVGVQTTFGPVPAEAVLLAAGVGSVSLARSVGVPLPLNTRSVSYCLFEPAEPGPCTRLPTVVDATTGAWLRRWGSGLTMLAGVTSAETGVPPTVQRAVPAAEQERVRDVVRYRCPFLAGARAVGGVTAHDAMVIGGDGAVTAWPQPIGLITAVGWNGGGFKLAPSVGDQVAGAGPRGPRLMPYPSWRLTPTDEMLHGSGSALGSTRVIQVLWRFRGPVSPSALEAEWRRLGQGRSAAKPCPRASPGPAVSG